MSSFFLDLIRRALTNACILFKCSSLSDNTFFPSVVFSLVEVVLVVVVIIVVRVDIAVGVAVVAFVAVVTIVVVEVVVVVAEV